MTILSELPDHIIGHIISLASLTNREAILVSLLSKGLFWAVQNRPALIFDGGRQEELEYVHSALVRYHKNHIPLDSFTFKMVDHPELKDRCISLAAKKRLRDLDLQGFHNFPEPFLDVESLVSLRLKDCYFLPRELKVWPNLKRLCLVNSDIISFENIIMASPLIEYLEVSCCNFYRDHFKVSNLHNLKQLCVGLCSKQTFEVKDAPELESITCSYRPLQRYWFSNSGHIIRPIQNIENSEYQNLRTLSLDSVGGSRDFFMDFGHQFPRLENLSILNNEVLEYLVLSSLSLKKIRLENIRKLENARFDVPNIVVFEYSITDTHCHPFIPEFSFSGKPRGWISCIRLSYRGLNGFIDNWCLKLHEFITSLNHSEISITVTFNNLPNYEYSPKNGRRNILAMRPRVYEFRIESVMEFSLSFASDVVDNIFRICQPQTVTFEPHHRDKFERLLYEKQLSEVISN